MGGRRSGKREEEFGKRKAKKQSGRDGFRAGGFVLRKGGFDEVLAEVPERAGEFAEIAEDVVERVHKPVDLFLADNQRGLS